MVAHRVGEPEIGASVVGSRDHAGVAGGPRETFLGEDRRCGDMDGGVERGRVWMACHCGAGLSLDLDPPAPTEPLRPPNTTAGDRSGE
jgi:hypothetical protein